jgi:hypothetical protein
MNQRFAALLALLAMAILLLLVSFVSRVWEGFRGQRGHGGHSGHSGVRYGIAYHDRGRVYGYGHGESRMSLNAQPHV